VNETKLNFIRGYIYLNQTQPMASDRLALTPDTVKSGLGWQPNVTINSWNSLKADNSVIVVTGLST